MVEIQIHRDRGTTIFGLPLSPFVETLRVSFLILLCVNCNFQLSEYGGKSEKEKKDTDKKI